MPADDLETAVRRSLEASAEVHRQLAAACSEDAAAAARTIASAVRNGGKVLFFGNGGSAADAQHLAAEFVGRFRLDREPLPAIALTTDTSTLTAIGNDYGVEQMFARQIEALAAAGDVAVAISTSGSSANVLAAVESARARGLHTIGMTGAAGTAFAALVEQPIVVPSHETERIQECHIAIGHVICEHVERLLFEAPAAAPSDVAHNGDRRGEVVSWAHLLELRERWRQEGKVVVWTNGCFDLVHVGHVRSLSAAGQFGDVLVVGVNGDESVRRLKGPGRPVVPADERAELVAAIDGVDYAVIFDDDTPEAVLARLRPDVHCKGADYEPPHGKPIPELGIVQSYGGRVEFLPLVPGKSSSDLIKRIC